MRRILKIELSFHKQMCKREENCIDILKIIKKKKTCKLLVQLCFQTDFVFHLNVQYIFTSEMNTNHVRMSSKGLEFFYDLGLCIFWYIQGF